MAGYKTHIALLCEDGFGTSPRPTLLALALAHAGYEISVIEHKRPRQAIKLAPPILANISFYTYERLAKDREKVDAALRARNFDALIYTSNRAPIAPLLASLSPDIVLVENIMLLPHAFLYKQRLGRKQGGGVYIGADLREFYPEQEGSASFKEGLGAVYEYICARYLGQLSFSLTVSYAIAYEYLSSYAIDPLLVYGMSYAPSLDALARASLHSTTQGIERVSLSTLKSAQGIESTFDSMYKVAQHKSKPPLRALYHGLISHERGSLDLLGLARLCEDVEFYYQVLSNDGALFATFAKEAEKIPNITLLAPTHYLDLVASSLPYDVGIIALAPTSLNNLYALPNKLFEYLAASLYVISYPSPCIARVLRTCGGGEVCEGFSISSLASLLAKLAREDAHIAGQTRRWEKNLHENAGATPHPPPHFLYNLPALVRLIEGLGCIDELNENVQNESELNENVQNGLNENELNKSTQDAQILG